MRCKRNIRQLLLFLFGLCTCSVLANAMTFTAIDDPWAGSCGTVLKAIDGSNIVGFSFGNGTLEHGFLYNGSFTKIVVPLASIYTDARGIQGNIIVGDYEGTGFSHGFLYDGSTYTTIDDPLGAYGTHATGICGSHIIGSYQDSNLALHGFL